MHDRIYKGEKTWYSHDIAPCPCNTSYLSFHSSSMAPMPSRVEPNQGQRMHVLSNDHCTKSYGAVDDDNLCLGISPPECSTVRVLEGTVATGEDDDLDNHRSGTYIGLGGQAVVCCLGDQGCCEWFRGRLGYRVQANDPRMA